MVRASPCGGEGRGFESRQIPKFLSQLVSKHTRFPSSFCLTKSVILIVLNVNYFFHISAHSQSPRTIALSRVSTKPFLVLGLLLTSIFLPSLIHQQAITGPLINAILLLITSLAGPSAAIMTGLVPSVIALSRGLLPVALAPVVPFIMIANAVYVVVFAQLKEKNFAGAVAAASISKFVLLHLVSQVLLAQLLPGKFLTVASKMMSWPQLVTALVGGLIAWVALQAINQSKNN